MPQNVIDAVQLELLKFPIGKFNPDRTFTSDDLTKFVTEIDSLPALLRQTVVNLSDDQLETPYRPGGWTVRQTVHHLADSHINSFIRFKLALTEDNPTIKPYEEQLWAELPDGKSEPIEVSLVLLEALHYRWVVLLKSLGPLEWKRTFIHPVSGENTLIRTAGLYAWHGKHHLAHINNLREAKGW